MPPKKKPDSEKAVFAPPISFRWNPELHAHHGEALAILNEYREKGHKDREIFASALQHFAGQKVKAGTQKDVLARLERIEGKIDEQAQHYALIVEALQNMDLSAFVDSNGRTFSEELGDRVPQTTYQQIQQNVSAADFDVD